MDTLFLLDDACRIDMHNLSNLESGYQEDEQRHAEENADGPIPTVCVLLFDYSLFTTSAGFSLAAFHTR